MCNCAANTSLLLSLMWMTFVMYSLGIVLWQMTQMTQMLRVYNLKSSSGRPPCPQRRSRRGEAFHVRILEGFWVCGRVCGDRSVFVTSHRPAHMSRVHASSLIKLCISHLKCFLFAWPCVSIPDYAVTRIYSGYAFTGYCLQFDQVFLLFTLASSGPQGSLDSINSHIGLF